jgi:hypothetical protein
VLRLLVLLRAEAGLRWGVDGRVSGPVHARR